MVLRVALLAGFSYANYYLIANFMNCFLPLVSSITKGEAIAMNTLLLFFDFLLLPLFGLLSLKIRKEVLIIISIIGIGCCCCPLFLLLNKATLFKAAFVRIVLMIFGVVLAAPYHAWVYENTPINHRYLIGAFSTAIGGKVLGGPILPLGLWLYYKTGLVVAPTFPFIIVGILSLGMMLQGELSKKSASLNSL